MTTFVSTASALNPQQLTALVDDLIALPSLYFLRWPHRVSGFVSLRPTDFPGEEGQFFTSQSELRWKRRTTGYEVLFLSIKSDGSDGGLEALPGAWSYRDCATLHYPEDETRFPKGLLSFTDSIAQRYFFDERTGTVHFVALTLR